MLFSYGNLITLVVVLLILVIYRALDRNNRSIEKLKRFSDKIAENMSALVAEKTTQVRDLSLEIQGSLKTGREILTRARGVEELLQSRASDMDEIQKRLAAYDTAFAELTTMSGRVDKNLQRLRDESGFIDDLDRKVEGASARLDAMERMLPALEEDIAVRGRNAVAAVKDEMVGALDAKVATIVAELSASEAKVKDYSAYLARLEAREEQSAKERLAGYAKAINSFDADLRGRLSEAAKRSETLAEEVVGRLSQRIQEQQAAIAESIETVNGRLAEAPKVLDSFDAGLRGRLADAAKRSETLEDEVFHRLAQRIQEDEAAIAKSMEAMEARVADYQGDVDYRVAALEDAAHDADALRATLTETVERVGAEARTEMKTLGAELVAGWTSEVAAAATARDQLRAGMAAVESEMESLKSRAYQDVEKKLSVFEDEFFADLRARSTGMQEKFVAWQAEMDRRTTELETEVKERTATAEESVHALRDALRADVEKAKKDAFLGFEKDLGALRDSLETGSRKMHREIEAGLTALASGLEAGRKELAELFDSSRAEVTAWEGRAREQLAQTELAIADRIAALSTEASTSIGAVRESFAAQKDELIVGTNEERLALRRELSGMAETIAAYRTELQQATDASVQALGARMETFQADSQKRVRDMQAELDAKLKEQRQVLADAREKADAMQEKLFGKIDESYRVLAGNVAEIDKRVKGFQSQTRLFERADSLKAALEGTIEDMKKEMAKLNAERVEIAEIETQLAKTRKVAEEVSSKMTRFLAEKRRIEDMDGEFKKIITLSRDVDLKLDTLSASSDALQQIQAKIRQFEEMGKAVEGGYERLEKKKEIITVTAEGVDRGFQKLEGIEKSLQEADRAADALASKVAAMKTDYETLAANKKDADAAMETVGRLGGIIAELEERLEKAQGAREWMARTETRFEEIGRQAQDQVRLLESIIKAETKKEKGERGAPPLDKRETVVKLSHQGWSVQEISRVTQLSRGEVELILELAPKV